MSLASERWAEADEMNDLSVVRGSQRWAQVYIFLNIFLLNLFFFTYELLKKIMFCVLISLVRV